MKWITAVGGRKLIGFFSCLMVGGVLSYFGKLDITTATFIASILGVYIGGNTGNALAGCIRSFAENRHPPAPAGPTGGGDSSDGDQ